MLKGGKGQQLPMFMTARELGAGVRSGKIGSHEIDMWDDDPEFMMDTKLTESKKDKVDGLEGHGSGVYDSIYEKGFQGHVTMDFSGKRPSLAEGHHRVAAAESIDQATGRDTFVPVDWYHREHGMWNTLNTYETRFPQNFGDTPKWRRNYEA